MPKHLASLFILIHSFAPGMLYVDEIVKKKMEGASWTGEVQILEKHSYRGLDGQTVTEALGAIAGEGRQVWIQFLGGEVGDEGTLIPGQPRPKVGHTYRAYLNPSEGGKYEVVGFDAGWKDLTPGSRSYSRNRTDGSNGSGNGAYLYWPSNNIPVPYFISLPTFLSFPTFGAAIDASFQTWRNVSGATIDFIGMGCSKITNNENDGVNNVIYVSQNWQYDSSIIALTRNFYVSGDSAKAGMILDTDILLNGVNFNFTTTNESGKYDVQNILTHEIGHFLGLGHEQGTVDTSATMYATAGPNETNKRTLHTNDIAGVIAAYSGSSTKGRFQASGCSQTRSGVSCAARHPDSSAEASKNNFLGFVAIALAWVFTKIWLRRRLF